MILTQQGTVMHAYITAANNGKDAPLQPSVAPQSLRHGTCRPPAHAQPWWPTACLQPPIMPPHAVYSLQPCRKQQLQGCKNAAPVGLPPALLQPERCSHNLIPDTRLVCNALGPSGTTPRRRSSTPCPASLPAVPSSSCCRISTRQLCGKPSHHHTLRDRFDHTPALHSLPHHVHTAARAGASAPPRSTKPYTGISHATPARRCPAAASKPRCCRGPWPRVL
jgi:hypothetical protein